MNNALENKIISAKTGIILLRILYIFTFTLSALMLMDLSDKKASRAFVALIITSIIILITTIAIRFLWLRKLEKAQEKLDMAHQEYAHAKAKSAIKPNTIESPLSESDKKRIKKNCDIMRSQNLPYEENSNLIPTDAVVKIKTKEEIAKQMINDLVVAHKSSNRLSGISDIQDMSFFTWIIALQPNKTIFEKLSQISKGQIDNFTLNGMSYLYERVKLYMWILGLDDKPSLSKRCRPLSTIFMLARYHSMDELLENCKMISKEEIMEYADLITRYEQAVLNLSSNKRKPKKINIDTIIEHKAAMDFVTSFNPYLRS